MESESDVPLALSGWVNMMLQDQQAENEESVLCHLMGLNLNTLLVLEQRCPLLATVMDEQHWWELLYVRWFPITYKRLQHKPLAANAALFIHRNKEKEGKRNHLYRDLWKAQAWWTTSIQSNGHVVHIPKGASLAPALGDEFGLGPLFATASPYLFMAEQNNAPEQQIKERNWFWRKFPIYPAERKSDPTNLKHYEATPIPLPHKNILPLF